MRNKPGIAAAKVTTAVVLVVTLSLSAAPKHTLLLNGHSTDVPVIDVSGHPYVGLEALAKALNGSMSTAHSASGSVVGLSLPSGSDNSGLASAMPPAMKSSDAL